MSTEEYFDSLSPELQESIKKALDRADELGLYIEVLDAVDLWYLADKNLRGPRP